MKARSVMAPALLVLVVATGREAINLLSPAQGLDTEYVEAKSRASIRKLQWAEHLRHKEQFRIASLGTDISFLLAPPPPPPVNYYVNPATQGTGSCLSVANACQPASMWSLLVPSDHVEAASGTYAGPNEMLDPTDNLSGTSGNPIEFHAATDGGPKFDGEGVRFPCKFQNNDWWDVRGVDCGRSGESKDVLIISDVNHGVFKRIFAAQGSMCTNTQVIVVQRSYDTLLEDIASMGRGTKQFLGYSNTSQANNTVRRYFGDYDGTTVATPTTGITSNYSSAGWLYEDIIFRRHLSDSHTCSALPCPIMSYGFPQFSYFNATNSSCAPGSIQFTNGDLPNGDDMVVRYGAGGPTGDTHQRAFTRVYGFLTLTQATDDFRNVPIRPFYVFNASEVDLKDIITYQRRDGATKLRLQGCTSNYCTALGHPDPGTLTGDRITAIGTGPATIDSAANEWVVTNLHSVNTPASANIYTGANQAVMRYKYIDGVLNDGLSGRPGPNPLWPWAMNDRIKASSVWWGHDEIDVDAMRIAVYGQSPDEGAPTPTPTNTATNTSTPTNTNTPTPTWTSGGPTATPTPTPILPWCTDLHTDYIGGVPYRLAHPYPCDEPIHFLQQTPVS